MVGRRVLNWRPGSNSEVKWFLWGAAKRGWMEATGRACLGFGYPLEVGVGGGVASGSAAFDVADVSELLQLPG